MRNGLAPFRRRVVVESRAQRRELSAEEPQSVPAGFEAIAEALTAGTCPTAACAVAGHELARDGVSLGEALAGLRAAWAGVRGAPPDHEATEALAVAWSEATLEFLHDLSCEDPLTGLASLTHLRTRLAEVFREAERRGGPPGAGHALVVVELAGAARGATGGSFSRALVLAAVAEALRTVFSGEETLARVSPVRVVALVRRTRELPETVALVRTLLADLEVPRGCRVWVEGLPPGAEQAGQLLSDLAR
jgi:GGDEF domain-containing protein